MPGGGRHDDDRHMAVRDHVQELSRRFFLLIAILLTASSLVYVYRAAIIPVILQPLTLAFEDQKLMYLNPAGGFNFIFLISIYGGLAAVVPFLVHQLYGFIRPILPRAAQRLSARLLAASWLLLIAGILFGYFIAVPGALKFLNEFAGEYVSAALTADSYLNFLVAYTLGLGLLFQVPFIVIIGHYIKPWTPGGLMRSERWVILLSFIAAAIITPTPDPLNLVIVALPIILVYQIGVMTVLVSILKQRRRTRAAAVRTAVHRTSAAMQAREDPPLTLAKKAMPPVHQSPARPAPRAIDGLSLARRQAGSVQTLGGSVVSTASSTLAPPAGNPGVTTQKSTARYVGRGLVLQ